MEGAMGATVEAGEKYCAKYWASVVALMRRILGAEAPLRRSSSRSRYRRRSQSTLRSCTSSTTTWLTPSKSWSESILRSKMPAPKQLSEAGPSRRHASSLLQGCIRNRDWLSFWIPPVWLRLFRMSQLVNTATIDVCRFSDSGTTCRTEKEPCLPGGLGLKTDSVADDPSDVFTSLLLASLCSISVAL